jgi:hypothetical protein
MKVASGHGNLAVIATAFRACTERSVATTTRNPRWRRIDVRSERDSVAKDVQIYAEYRVFSVS